MKKLGKREGKGRQHVCLQGSQGKIWLEELKLQALELASFNYFSPYVYSLFHLPSSVHIWMSPLKGGDDSSPAPLTAIRGSKISVLIFSNHDYASSKWCLNEVVEILRMQTKVNNDVYPSIWYAIANRKFVDPEKNLREIPTESLQIYPHTHIYIYESTKSRYKSLDSCCYMYL